MVPGFSTVGQADSRSWLRREIHSRWYYFLAAASRKSCCFRQLQHGHLYRYVEVVPLIHRLFQGCLAGMFIRLKKIS